MENVIAFPKRESLLEEYEQFLSNKSNKTVDAYLRSIRQFISWFIGTTNNDSHGNVSRRIRN